MTFSIRDATLADLDAIMAIERAVFPIDAWPEEAMRAELGTRHGRYLAAIDDAGTLVGYAGLRVVGDQGDIQTIAVVPTSRRLGIARTMMVELLSEARRRRAADVFLEVRADNPSAVALYASLGFTELAVRPKYYPGATRADPQVDAVVMRIDRQGLRGVSQ